MIFVLLLLSLVGCESFEFEDPQEGGKGNILEDHLGSTDRIHTAGSPDLFVSSQPAKEDFQEARNRGISTVINLRSPGETPNLDEEQVVEEQGMNYYNPDFSRPQELSDDIFDRVRELLRTAERPILLHCSSANRASATWLPYRVLDEGVSLDRALREAREMGLSSQALEDRALDYISRNRDSGS